MRIYLSRDLRAANQSQAEDNRRMLKQNRAFMVNVLGAPGSGKTALLERTLPALSGKYDLAVIEGDLYTAEDALRLLPWCARVVQINTEGGCHLDAGAVGHLLKKEGMLAADIVFIENVGNLVCPAEFDLGEDCRVTLLSVTEGGDKPRKYPLAFRDAHCALITKLDLLPYCSFDLERVAEDIQKINVHLTIIPLSAKTGEGMNRWYQWLEEQKEKKSAMK